MKTDQPGGEFLAASENADARAILKARARALARPLPNRERTEADLTIVEFTLAGERYAVPTSAVREVHPFEDLTPLPCTPPFVLGIINWRGQILPVMDIKKFFDLPEEGITDLHKVIVMHHEEIELGILADGVTGVRTIPLGALQSSLPTLTGIREEYLMGVTAERLVVLDAARILGDRRILVNEEVEI